MLSEQAYLCPPGSRGSYSVADGRKFFSHQFKLSFRRFSSLFFDSGCDLLRGEPVLAGRPGLFEHYQYQASNIWITHLLTLVRFGQGVELDVDFAGDREGEVALIATKATVLRVLYPLVGVRADVQRTIFGDAFELAGGENVFDVFDFRKIRVAAFFVGTLDDYLAHSVNSLFP